MKRFFKLCAILFILVHAQMLSAEEKLIFGADLKRIAQSYLAERNIFNEGLNIRQESLLPMC